MNNSVYDDINRLNVSKELNYEGLGLLWVGAFFHGNRDCLNYRAHNHTFFEMHLVTAGSLSYMIDGHCCKIEAGSYLLIPPECIHGIMSHSDDFERISLSFEVKNNPLLYRALLEKSKCVNVISQDVFESLIYIKNHASDRIMFFDLIIKNRLLEIISLVASSQVNRRENVEDEKYDPRLTKIKKYIEDNPQIFPTCDELAAYCGLSTKQLGRLFKQYDGCSLLSFIHGNKIEQAKQLISNTDDNFSVISKKLGFSSVNYFGKFFLRITGVTPREYRAANGNG